MSGVRHALLASPGLFVPCWREAFATLRRPVPWIYLLPLLAAQTLTLFGLHVFPRGPMAAAILPLLRAAGGERATHYPDSYAVFPVVSGWIDVLLLFGIGTFCATAVVRALPTVLQGEARFGAAAGFASRLIDAWGFTLPAAGLVGGALIVAGRAEVSHEPLLALFALPLRIGALLSMALLAYGLPGVVIGRLSPTAAIRRSIGLAGTNLWTTVGFVASWWALTWPTRDWLARVGGRFGDIAPEVTIIGLGLQCLIASIALCWFLAGTTRLYLHFYGVRTGEGT